MQQMLPHNPQLENAGESDFNPILMLEVELSQPLPAIETTLSVSGQMYRRAMSLVRLHSHPLGLVELTVGPEGVSPAVYAQRIWQTLCTAINARLRQDGLPEVTRMDAGGLPASMKPLSMEVRDRLLANAPFVSIVICTRDRADSLRATMATLLKLNYPHYEIIVVDNAPLTGATEELVCSQYASTGKVRYVIEERPGLSWARNRGLAEARGAIVAYTDDDVVVDQHWLTSLVLGFYSADDVVCVTGLTLPAELETPAQVWFEEFGGFGNGFVRRIFDRDEHSPTNSQTRRMYPYAAGMFGSGNNMAFATTFLRRAGGFDVALGAGTVTQGGEDLAIYFQVISSGYKLVYEPTALNYHYHRRDYAGLCKQMYGYGAGLTAFITKSIMDDPRRIFELAGKLPFGLLYALNPYSSKNVKKAASYPRELTRLERRGMLDGPGAYLRSRKRVRNIIRQYGPFNLPTGRVAGQQVEQ